MGQCGKDHRDGRENIEDEKGPDGNSSLQEGLGVLSGGALHETVVQVARCQDGQAEAEGKAPHDNST